MKEEIRKVLIDMIENDELYLTMNHIQPTDSCGRPANVEVIISLAIDKRVPVGNEGYYGVEEVRNSDSNSPTVKRL